MLDIGGGLGGPARDLAHALACRVTVLDATPDFLDAGVLLTARMGLDRLVDFRHGSALAIPFPDGSFDAVWMQNVGMHIADKRRLVTEIARVLRPGGRLALQEVLAGPVQPPHYPLPWAVKATQSFLATSEELQALLAGAGLRVVAWHDALDLVPQTGAPSLQLLPILLWGEEQTQMKGTNYRRNVAEGRLQGIMTIAER